jgi:single-stranded-DNA-specific exonuclease
LIATHETYQEGVIGLIAGRIVEEYYRPAIVISRGEKVSKGSVRSISGFNIIEFLRQSSEFFINVGGHPMAAGFTIETSKIEQMQEVLEKLAEAVEDELFIRTIKIDCEISLDIITPKLFSALEQLAPFGMGNPEPVFVTKKAIIENMRVIGKEGKHVKFNLKSHPSAGSGGSTVKFDAIAFGFGEEADKFSIGESIDIVYTIIENNWNGRSSLELKVKDIRLST